MQHGEFRKIRHFQLCNYHLLNKIYIYKASTNIISNFETIEIQHNPVIIPVQASQYTNISSSML